MRVEGPQTFMTAYQQGRQNRRQDEQDNQKLAFSIFGEKRARDKHDAFIDKAEEDTRAAKTMNPLMESLRLYENQLKFNTLDSSISRHLEKTRADKQGHILSEARKTSELDAYNTQKLQKPGDYNYRSGMGPEEQDMIGRTRDGVDELKLAGVNLGNLEMDTKTDEARIKNQLGGYILNDGFKLMTDEQKSEYGIQGFENKYTYPVENQNRLFGLGFTENDITELTQGFEKKSIAGAETNLAEMGAMNKDFTTKYDIWKEMPDGEEKEAKRQELLKLKELIGGKGMLQQVGGK